MRFPTPLIEGRLERRYKRFLADVTLPGEGLVTAHCPNPGAMLGLDAPGARAWVSVTASKTRKLPHTLEIVEADGALVGINTMRPNALAEEAVREGAIPELGGYQNLRREVRYGEASRIDLLLEDDARPPCFVEVKNVHLHRGAGLAEFPDCVTARGAKHLRELAREARDGARAVQLFIVQRADCDAFALAADIDPGYAASFEAAVAAGVEPLVYACDVAPDAITVARRLALKEPVA